MTQATSFSSASPVARKLVQWGAQPFGRASYRSKHAEFVLYFLTVSGLMLWQGFSLPWSLLGPVLAAHFVVSLILFPLIVLPFWLAHRAMLRRRGRPALRHTGRVIEWALILLVVSGVYMSLWGNRGELAGQIAYWAHLLPALPLALLVIVHAWRFSMLRAGAWLMGFGLAMLALTLPAYAASESGSLLLTGDGKTLISANFDSGALSFVDRETGVRTGEIQLGGELRRVALDEASHMLGVTDYLGGRVLFVDLQSRQIRAEIATGGRPFGIVFDARNQLFWVTLFEAGRLLAIAPESGIVASHEVPETPRGLALLGDGRLLVSHAMIGKVSLWDTTRSPARWLRSIELHASQEPDEFVSQGLVRLLDDIAVSPDETEAWLPHVLWNFDHPFQFQSTIFPSLSLLDLTPGAEAELPERRKHLFRQINIIDTGNRTRIVSNPHDAAFSDDGKKVYVTLAGSEDLMVFDLSRRAAIGSDKERSARRAGKRRQGGAKAMQIFRHLPGDNPRGLVVSGDDIYVQNAMSLDLVHLTRGGDGPFARVRLAGEAPVALVAEDPVDPALRRGKTLFHSANSDDGPAAPTTGDFWMSCQSCHLDGFNFTTGHLFRAGPTDKYDSAVIGHRGLDKMIAGDFIGDYIRIMQSTQGGMGHDPRDGAPRIDPAAPPHALATDMAALHSYVTARENLPLTSSWLRLEDDRRTVHEKDWVNSAACAACHSDMFEQWSDSMHRLMGDSNPYYKVVEEVAAQTEGEAFRQWCMGCHHPQGLLSGLTATVEEGHMFERGGASLFEALAEDRPDLDEGTGCLFCHRIVSLEAARGARAGGNASFTVNVEERDRYVFEDSDNAVLNWAGNHQINARPQVHAESYSQPFYKDSALCSTCHNEFAPGTGSVIVDTYGEWEASAYNNPADPAQHRSCIDCHMHGDIGRIGEDIPGISTDGGRLKDNVVTHQFTGANHHLVGLRNPDLADMSLDLLRSAARLDGWLDDAGGLVIRVANVGAGHALPTGVADFRQLWLDVTVTDATGRLVLEHGKMDDSGNLAPDARLFQKVFGDAEGKPVGLRFWRYEKMLKDTKIPANGHRDEAFDLPRDAVFPLQAEVRMMFRIYPQWVTDAVRQTYPELPEPQAVEMARWQAVLERR